ncbi:MAG: hypothetical protein M3303_11830 [Gemmatimonadota bacterium]|nr:hypothetical protein [Gemmatimonadota bacterium]
MSRLAGRERTTTGKSGADESASAALPGVGGDVFRGGQLRTILNRYAQAHFTQIAQASACNRVHTMRQRCVLDGVRVSEAERSIVGDAAHARSMNQRPISMRRIARLGNVAMRTRRYAGVRAECT